MAQPSITILNSWFTDVQRGSGTTRSINTIINGLRRRGYRLQILSGGRSVDSHQRRIRFNQRLADQPKLVRGDIIFGFDADGWRWAATRDRTKPYLVFIKGMLADEARFEKGLIKKTMLTEAAWEQKNCQAADLVVADSFYLKRQIEKRYHLSPKKVLVIPECVDVKQWKIRPTKKAGRNQTTAITILTVAQTYPRKNIEQLLKAARLLVKKYPVKFQLVGGGPEWLNLHDQVTQWQLEPFVSFHQQVSDQKLRSFYHQADIFCLPSRQEGFGIVFLEAMAAGLPIVALNQSAMPEVIGHRAGILVDDSTTKLAQALERLITDSRLRRTMGAAGLLRVTQFDQARVIAKIEKLIGRLGH